MSYSRWSYSTWYTFWSSLEEETVCEFKFPTKKLKYVQTFEICDFPSYYITYGELMENGLFKTLDDVKKYYHQNHSKFTDHRFIEDVDEHFKWGNFFRYEWYYPLRNKMANFSWFK